jgi:hypothetical protein
MSPRRHPTVLDPAPSTSGCRVEPSIGADIPAISLSMAYKQDDVGKYNLKVWLAGSGSTIERPDPVHQLRYCH